MTSYLVGRLFQSLLVLAIMSFVIYGLIGLMPGDPIDLMIEADPSLTPADQERLRALYGLDRPIVERYWNWLTAALSGDLGYSRLYSQPVPDILLPRLGSTVVLLLTAMALSLAIALPLGVAAAAMPGTRLAGAINLFAFAGISMPPFWLAILLITLFAVFLGWLPAGGMGVGPDMTFGDRLRHMILPVTALTLASVGGMLRYVRAAMREALRQDYIRTARAKGLSRRQVLFGHALRNAMLPVVTIIALDMGTLFSGALITETLFAWMGMGKTIYDAIMGNDFNLALVGLLFATGLVLAANLLADLCYVWLDPRVSLR